ncbi:MAG: stage III sporulation protein AD [Lachnospiraceae bacterium]|nr:stage III sporulation protein AD [Lachnospiraceae bacterium]
MADVMKVGILGIAGAMIALLFKGERKEYAIYVAFAVSLLIFAFALRLFGAYLEQFSKLQQFLGDKQTYLTTLFKVIGITYLCEFSSGICKDAGYTSIADQIEVFGKITILLAGMPILFAVIEQIQAFMS